MDVRISEARLREHVKRICKKNIRGCAKICSETCPIRKYVDKILREDR